MNTLVTASLEKKDITKLVEFPRFLLQKWETDLLDWILEYQRKYGQPPAVERLERAFKTFVPLASSDPLGDLYDQELEAKKTHYAKALLEQQLKSIDDGEVFSLDEHFAAMQELALASSTIHRYTSFDRSQYFRTGESIKLGLNLIDRATEGTFPGEVLLVVGRLGTGKSTLSQFFSHTWIMSEPRKILFVSKEMPPADVFARLDAIVGKFNPKDLRSKENKDLLEPQLEVVKRIVKATKSEILMPRLNVWNVEQIGSLSRMFDVDAVIIDGAYHLTTTQSRRNAANWENLTDVSRAIKAMALETNTKVLVTSQLKRGTYSAEKLTPEDIAFADALGQDADQILAIRPLGIPKKHRVELQLIKNRFGPEVATIAEVHYNTMSLIDISVEGDDESS